MAPFFVSRHPPPPTFVSTGTRDDSIHLWYTNACSTREIQRHAGEDTGTDPSLSRLPLAMSAWSVEIRRAPSRHCRDAKVNGHTTSAMHNTTIIHPPTPLSLHSVYHRLLLQQPLRTSECNIVRAAISFHLIVHTVRTINYYQYWNLSEHRKSNIARAPSHLPPTFRT